MNLLSKIEEALKDPRITVHERNPRHRWERVNDIETENYEWDFYVAPKEGFRRIDEDSIRGLAELQDGVFHELKDKEYQTQYGSFRDTASHPLQGVRFVYPGLATYPKGHFYSGRVIAGEPIGIKEHWKRFTADIFPEYAEEFEESERHREDSNNYKTAITRTTIVRIAPSLEYLKLFRKLQHQEKQALKGKKIYDEMRPIWDDFKQRIEQMGFVDIDSIIIDNYNRTFGTAT